MRLTAELLRSKRACADELAVFEALFPDGVKVTEAACVAVAGRFESSTWAWVARRFLSENELDAYLAALKQIDADNWTALRPIVDACRIALKPADDTSWTALNALNNAYEPAFRPIRDAYRRNLAALFGRIAEGMK